MVCLIEFGLVGFSFVFALGSGFGASEDRSIYLSTLVVPRFPFLFPVSHAMHIPVVWYCLLLLTGDTNAFLLLLFSLVRVDMVWYGLFE